MVGVPAGIWETQFSVMARGVAMSAIRHAITSLLHVRMDLTPIKTYLLFSQMGKFIDNR